MAIHDVRFPGESDDYRAARDELLQAEIDLRRRTEEVAAQRRALPAGGEVPGDYVFEEWDAGAGTVREAKLSELFGDKDSLFLYSFMFNPDESGRPLRVACPSCTSIMDGMDGAARSIAQRAAFAVEAKAPIETFSAHAHARGWRHARLLSSSGNSYRSDYHAETDDASQWPIATVFARSGGRSTTCGAASCSGRRWKPARTRVTSTSCGRSGPCSTGCPRDATRP